MYTMMAANFLAQSMISRHQHHDKREWLWLASLRQIRCPPDCWNKFGRILSLCNTFIPLFNPMCDGLKDSGRGLKKGQFILQYVREHPEELRAFEQKDRRGENSPI